MKKWQIFLAHIGTAAVSVLASLMVLLFVVPFGAISWVISLLWGVMTGLLYWLILNRHFAVKVPTGDAPRLSWWMVVRKNLSCARISLLIILAGFGCLFLSNRIQGGEMQLDISFFAIPVMAFLTEMVCMLLQYERSWAKKQELRGR